MKKEHVVIIGSGFGGLGSACLLAKAGYKVTLLEKNEAVGGRASILEKDGYKFDMGPSWYLMPDVFEHFYTLLGEDINEHLTLKPLDPSYRIFFGGTDKVVDIYKGIEKNQKVFEDLEPGSTERFRDYLKRSEYQYNIALKSFVYKNYSSIRDFLTLRVATEGMKLSVFTTMDRYVKRFFKTDAMQKIMQYTLVFLGSSPYNTPALYNIMTHVDFNMGVFYPNGGIYAIIDSLKKIAEKHGVEIKTHTPATKILTENGKVVGVETPDGRIDADIVISNADYHHTETQLLDKKDRDHDDKFWNKKTLAPSALLIYLGVDGEISSLKHHSLLFSKDWKKNFAEIFDNPTWPTDPSLYVCNPSKTDPSVAPKGKENLFILVPIASGLKYTEEELKEQRDKTIKLVSESMNIPDLEERIEFEQVFCTKDFISRYNSFKGSALGLAHTLTQTASFRPDTQSKKVKNLYFVGGNTNPGIGMPMCLVSAELVYKRMIGDKSAEPLRSL